MGCALHEKEREEIRVNEAVRMIDLEVETKGRVVRLSGFIGY